MNTQAILAIQNIKRNLMTEIVLTIPMFAVSYFLFGYSGILFSPVVWVALGILTFGAHTLLYFSLSEQKDKSSNAKKITAFISSYKPLIALAAFIVAYELTLSFMTAVLVQAIITILAIYPIKLYVQKLYGKHYEVLKNS